MTHVEQGLSNLCNHSTVHAWQNSSRFCACQDLPRNACIMSIEFIRMLAELCGDSCRSLSQAGCNMLRIQNLIQLCAVSSHSTSSSHKNTHAVRTSPDPTQGRLGILAAELMPLECCHHTTLPPSAKPWHLEISRRCTKAVQGALAP